MSQIQPPSQYYPPPAPRQPVNGLGIAGFIISLAGFFTACILSPVGLLLSFIALFKRPRGFAVAGVILGLLGSIIPALIISFFGFIIFSAVMLGKPGFQTVIAVQEAGTTIKRHASNNNYTLPDDFDGNALLAGTRDGWSRPLHYRRTNDFSFELRSAGPDGLLQTQDDLEQRFDGPARRGPE